MYDLFSIAASSDELTSYLHIIPKKTPENPPKKFSQNSEEIAIAFGARDGFKPIGVAWATFSKITKQCTIQDIFVLPEYRSQQLGRQLLLHLKQGAYKEGARFCFFVYPSNSSFTSPIQKIIKATQWKGDRPFLLQCYFNHTFNPSWIQRKDRYPEGYEEFKWETLNPKEKELLQHQVEQKNFPSFISPFFNEWQIEPLNSLGLRYQGEIVGWIITHRLTADLIKYQSFFILPSLRNQKVSIKLLFDSIRYHLPRLNQAVFEVPLLQVKSSWLHFVEHRLIPHACEVSRYNQAWDFLESY